MGLLKTLSSQLTSAELAKMTRGKRTRQIAALYGANIIAVFAGFGVSLVNTHLLGEQGYGDYKLVETIFLLGSTISAFGLFMSGGRLIAQKQHDSLQHQLIGAVLVSGLVTTLLAVLGLLAFSTLVESLFHRPLNGTVAVFSLLFFVFPLKNLLTAVCQGNNAIYKLALLRCLPMAGYLGIILLVQHWADISVSDALLIRYTAMGTVFVMITVSLRPAFSQLRARAVMIWQENKAYGLHVYYGTLAGTASTQLGMVLVAFFVDTTTLGFYGLAMTMAMPMTLLPNAVGMTFFKNFANTDRIPLKATLATLLSTASALVGFQLVVPLVIDWFYPAGFQPAIRLAQWLAVACCIHGLGDFLTHFLRSQGLGRDIRNTAFLLGAVNLIGYPIMIDWLGEQGAVLVRMVAALAYLLLLWYYYARYRRTMPQQQ